MIQSTKRPGSLAPALADSPSGLAAWILDKYRDWSDCHGDLESVFDRRTLLDIATLYWVTNSIGTSFLPYVDDPKTPPLGAVGAPAGLTLTPEDAGYPREFADRLLGVAPRSSDPTPIRPRPKATRRGWEPPRSASSAALPVRS
jgi:hypothetical protein